MQNILSFVDAQSRISTYYAHHTGLKPILIKKAVNGFYQKSFPH
jgi:hypothetical protein